MTRSMVYKDQGYLGRFLDIGKKKWQVFKILKLVANFTCQRQWMRNSLWCQLGWIWILRSNYLLPPNWGRRIKLRLKSKEISPPDLRHLVILEFDVSSAHKGSTWKSPQRWPWFKEGRTYQIFSDPKLKRVEIEMQVERNASVNDVWIPTVLFVFADQAIWNSRIRKLPWTKELGVFYHSTPYFMRSWEALSQISAYLINEKNRRNNLSKSFRRSPCIFIILMRYDNDGSLPPFGLSPCFRVFSSPSTKY